MILLTGATGFTGRFVLEELKKNKDAVRCFVRPSSDQDKIKNLADEIMVGDITNLEAVKKAMKGVKGVINVVSFKEGHIPVIIEAAESLGVKRVLFFSTTAIFTKLNAKSKALRVTVEERIRKSNLHWTILRPTMIYGTIDDRNMIRLIRSIDRFPIHPILGSGDKLIQPIYVKDLASAAVKAFYCRESIKKAYNLSGKNPLSYRECVQTVANLLDKKCLMLPLSVWLAITLTWLVQKIPGLPNIKPEQVHRLNEDKNFDHLEATKDFGFNPKSFSEGIALEIAEYKK